MEGCDNEVERYFYSDQTQIPQIFRHYLFFTVLKNESRGRNPYGDKHRSNEKRERKELCLQEAEEYWKMRIPDAKTVRTLKCIEKVMLQGSFDYDAVEFANRTNSLEVFLTLSLNLK